MMKGVMMTAMLAVTDIPATGESEPAPAKSEPPTGQSEAAQGKTEAGVQVVKSLVSAGKQAYTSPYTVTVKKIEPIQGSNQVRVTFFVTGEDEPAHDFTETGSQVVAAFLNAGMHANAAASSASGASAPPTASVQKIEAVEGGDDDSDEDSDENSDDDALSGLVADADAPTTAAGVQPTAPSAAPTEPTAPQPTSAMTPDAAAGKVPTLPAAAPMAGDRPTTSDSSPVQQPGTTLGDVPGEEAANDGPAEHEGPPRKG